MPVRNRGARVIAYLAPALLVWGGAAAHAGAPTAIVHLDRSSTLCIVQTSERPSPGSRVLLADGLRPLAWLRPVQVPWHLAPGRCAFAAIPPRHLDSQAAVRAWLISPEVVARTLDRWPAGAEYQARLDGLGPAGRSAWIAAGARAGIRPGMSWWLRVAGQPAARLDVRTVGADECFAAVVALAWPLPMDGSETVTLLQPPGRAAQGQARSAVCYVEPRERSQNVWLAAPPGVDAPADPVVDFWRGGVYVGHGVVERRDERFWYARTVPQAGREPVRVGDDVWIRTSADIASRRFVARVFDVGAEGCLINAGEAEGLAPGERGWAYRDGRVLGEVTVERVQAAYAVVRLARPAGATDDPEALQRLDVVRFAPPARRLRRVGWIERVVDGAALAVRLDAGQEAPLDTPLAIRRPGGTVGVALLVAASDGAVPRSDDAAQPLGDALEAAGRQAAQTDDARVPHVDEQRAGAGGMAQRAVSGEGTQALGFVLECTRTGPVEPGLEVVLEEALE